MRVIRKNLKLCHGAFPAVTIRCNRIAGQSVLIETFYSPANVSLLACQYLHACLHLLIDACVWSKCWLKLVVKRVSVACVPSCTPTQHTHTHTHTQTPHHPILLPINNTISHGPPLKFLSCNLPHIMVQVIRSRAFCFVILKRRATFAARPTPPTWPARYIRPSKAILSCNLQYCFKIVF